MHAAVKQLTDIIKTQVNAKDVQVTKSFADIKQAVKANPGTLGRSFGKKAPGIIAKLAEESAESILGALAKEKKFSITIGSEKFDLNPEHVVIERDVPTHLAAMEFKDGIAYLDTTRTPELEAEGFAREIMRRIQSLRKDGGLDKRDQIHVILHGDKSFLATLQPWETAIKDKVGAKTIKLTDQPPARKHEHASEELVKDKKYAIFFDKA